MELYRGNLPARKILEKADDRLTMDLEDAEEELGSKLFPVLAFLPQRESVFDLTQSAAYHEALKFFHVTKTTKHALTRTLNKLADLFLIAMCDLPREPEVRDIMNLTIHQLRGINSLRESEKEIIMESLAESNETRCRPYDNLLNLNGL